MHNCSPHQWLGQSLELNSSLCSTPSFAVAYLTHPGGLVGSCSPLSEIDRRSSRVCSAPVDRNRVILACLKALRACVDTSGAFCTDNISQACMGTSGAFCTGWRAGLRRRNGLRPLEESAPSVESGVQGIQETEYAVGIEPANREGPMGDNAG